MLRVIWRVLLILGALGWWYDAIRVYGMLASQDTTMAFSGVLAFVFVGLHLLLASLRDILKDAANA